MTTNGITEQFVGRKTIKEMVDSMEMGDHNKARALELFNAGQYTEHSNESVPEQYVENNSEICWGWLARADDRKFNWSMTFAHGERGNESFDPYVEGLHIWYGISDPDAGPADQYTVDGPTVFPSHLLEFDAAG